MNAVAAAALRWMARIAAASVLMLAVSCGGGGSQTAVAPAAPSASRAAIQPLAAPAALTPDQLMDWAEAQYPQLFPADGKSAGFFAPYTYRHYPAADNYLGVSTGADDVAVYVYGNLTGWQVTRLAPLAGYACTVLPLSCAQEPLSPNIAAWGDSLTPPFAANLQLLYPDRVVYNGGVAANSSTDVALRLIADTERHSWITIFWAGQNNAGAPEQIKADVADSVAVLLPANPRFIVMSVTNRAVPEELKGTAKYQAIVQLNSELGAAYPQNYLDIRSYLISQYNPANAQDVIDVQNDVVPSSLRFPNDENHLNNDGSVLVARKVQEFIRAKGW